MAADTRSLRLLATNGQINWTVHATQRLFERGIKKEDVVHILSSSKNELLETQPPKREWESERYAVYSLDHPVIIVIVVVEFVPTPSLLALTAEFPDDKKWIENKNPPPTLVRIR